MPTGYVRPVYQELASLIQARENCRKSNNSEWLNRHTLRADLLTRESMPHGSGIDADVMLDFDSSTPERLVFGLSFHHMDGNGFYDGWTDHQVIVRPSLMSAFELRITGRNRNDIKDYLHEVFDVALRQAVDVGEFYAKHEAE